MHRFSVLILLSGTLSLTPQALPSMAPTLQSFLGGPRPSTSYLSKLLPDAGAVAQGEGKISEPRPVGERPSGSVCPHHGPHQ